MKEHLEGDLDKDSAQTTTLPAISEAQRRKEREIVAKEVRNNGCVDLCTMSL